MNVILMLLVMGVGLVQASYRLDRLKGEEEQEELPFRRKRIEDIPGLTKDMLVKAIEEAKRETQEEEAKTPRGNHYHSDSSSYYHHFVPELEPVRIGALVKERTVRKLAEKLGLSHRRSARALDGLDNPQFSGICKDLPESDDNYQYTVPKGYRRIDGGHNNLKNAKFGRAKSTFRRLFPPEYADGISAPRKGAEGNDLPNARTVSKEVFKDLDRPSSTLSHMAVMWGQFLNHDMVLSAQPDISCPKDCSNTGECIGISIPQNDEPFHGRQCINMKRDVPTCTNRIYRGQINTVSSFIDASGVYSNDPIVFNWLRDPSDPALLVEKINPTPGKKKLLSSDLSSVFCVTDEPNKKPCFRSGDARMNQNPGLASMHTIWNREHNRIVGQLRKFTGKSWDPNKLFFEARKIVGAMIQHITYNEFLPAILDKDLRARWNITLEEKGYSKKYDPNLEPSICNSFAGAAYRGFGHSLIQNQMNRFGKGYNQKFSPVPMNSFHDPTSLYESNKGGVDSILRGLAKDKAQSVDGSFAKSVQEMLVRGPDDLSDLPAINIQRGRDRGLPSYNKVRKLTDKLTEAKDFEGFKNEIKSAEKRQKLKDVYQNKVNDVDLFVGGLYEDPVPGGVMGPTFSAIFGDQFRRLRCGDRFWYENPDQFKPKQLEEIRRATLARVICDNSDGINEIPNIAIKNQKFVSCSDVKSMNFMEW